MTETISDRNPCFDILDLLDERGGYVTGQIAQKLDPGSYAADARRTTRRVRNQLLRLQSSGLVAYLDNEKPACWVRTKAGTKHYEENSRKS